MARESFTNYVDKMRLVGWWPVVEMSTICRFSLIKVKDLLH